MKVTQPAMTRDLKRIATRDATGALTGWLLPIWHEDDGYHVDQVYLTVVEAGKKKGPHLHWYREGRFTCIKGNIRLVTRDDSGEYHETLMGEDHGFKTVVVAPGTPAALYNTWGSDAYVLNMPSPPWRDNSDEHTVDDWEYPKSA